VFRSTSGVLTVAVVCTLAASVLSGCGGATHSASAASGGTSVVRANSGPTTLAATREQAPAACRGDLSSPTVAAAVASLPIEPVTHSRWETSPATLTGNFNPCATLSTAIVTIQGATASSPEHALMLGCH
jgi:FlaG/FlaF family flagellin (archaellin)